MPLTSVILHELHFTNMGATAGPEAVTLRCSRAGFKSFSRWQADFIATARQAEMALML